MQGKFGQIYKISLKALGTVILDNLSLRVQRVNIKIKVYDTLKANQTGNYNGKLS